MKKKTILGSALVLGAMLLAACNQAEPSSSPSGSSPSSDGPTSSDVPSTISSHDADATQAYMEDLYAKSENNHLYYHYLRYDNRPTNYANWDVWAWQYGPMAGEGSRFNWVGRTTNPSSDTKEATGDATIDDFGGAYIDIDLGKTYDGGWDANAKKMGGKTTSFDGATRIGLQIVKSETRISGSGFWVNDGGNVVLDLADFKVEKNNKVFYHCFVLESKVQTTKQLFPIGGADLSDPFALDDGTSITKGLDKYNDVDWSKTAPIQATSEEFLKGGDVLENGAGVGYQIMVSSFADSDGDGFGDIYGIDQKLDYLKSLGVNAIWLTPIQLSDSYHGYDISDYNQVDPKFGSKVSPAALENNGRVTPATAMEDYKLLLHDAHEKGMVVVMDLVLNHTATTNTWFIKSSQLEDGYRGYYQWGNHETDSDVTEEKYWYPYGETVYSYYAKFGTGMPELNYSCTSTRAAMKAVALNWMEIGVDGFRMDAVKHIYMSDEADKAAGDTIISDVSKSGDYSSNLTKNLHFWRQLALDVKSVYPNAFFVGENFDGHAYHCAPFYEGFDSIFDFYSYFNLTSAAAKSHTPAIPVNAASFLGANAGSAVTDCTGSSYHYQSDSRWDLSHVLQVNNKYRTGGTAADNTDGFSMINGAFTSNHDIARCINRVAGTAYDSNGLTAQGAITQSNYAQMLELATDVEIAELMLPGCTWIYYGDEIGMTGNWLANAKSADDGYADLAYRQPMKWVDDALDEEGNPKEGTFTTKYGVTGSGMVVGWDEINSTNLVKSVEDVVENGDAHFDAIKSFANLKSATSTLIRGNFQASSSLGANVYDVTRTLGDSKVRVIVNFTNSAVNPNAQGEVLASYKGATASTVPAHGAVAIQISGGEEIPDTLTVKEGEIYFDYTAKPEWGDSACYAYFWNDAGTVGSAWPGTQMAHACTSPKVLSIAIPTGATKVIFSRAVGSSQEQTVDLTIGDFNYFTIGSLSGNKYTATGSKVPLS